MCARAITVRERSRTIWACDCDLGFKILGIYDFGIVLRLHITVSTIGHFLSRLYF